MALSVKLTCLAYVLAMGQLVLYTPSVSGHWVPPRFKKWCPSGWIRFQSSCYIFVQDTKTWPEAQTSCRALGGNLVRIDGAEEDAFIDQLLGRGGKAWLGISDLEKEEQFKLISSHRLAPFGRFLEGEPNNKHVAEHCLEMINAQGWNDLPCSRRQRFVCES